MAEMKSTVHGRGLLERSPLFAAMDERSRHELVAHAVNPCCAMSVVDLVTPVRLDHVRDGAPGAEPKTK
jgi:hypothetical protein